MPGSGVLYTVEGTRSRPAEEAIDLTNRTREPRGSTTTVTMIPPHLVEKNYSQILRATFSKSPIEPHVKPLSEYLNLADGGKINTGGFVPKLKMIVPERPGPP